MYVILVYDIADKKVSKVMRVCRQYLTHIQNSVFEGEISDSNYKELMLKLKKICNFSVDSLIIFKFRSDSLFSKEVIGCKDAEISNFI